MSIEIDDAKFQQILEITVGDRRLEPRELQAVVQLVELAAAIDLDDDPAERRLVQVLIARLCAWGGLATAGIPPVSPIPTDAEERAARLAMLAPRLVTSAARDLAFALAYLVIVVDLELAPVESELIEQLQRELAISRDRAGELADAIAWIVTPEDVPVAAPGTGPRRAPGVPSPTPGA